MNRFAELLDRIAYEPGRNNKIRLVAAYLRETEDPDRGYALAAMTGALSFKNAKAGVIRALIAERTDPALFALSYDYVGDLSETVALMWTPLPTTHSVRGGRGKESVASPPSQRSLANIIRRRRNALDTRQGAVAGADRALARCTR